MAWIGRVALLVAATCVFGCGASSAASSTPRRRTVAGVTFLPAGAQVRRECRQTANAVHYAVPCPTLLPQGMKAVTGGHGCEGEIVGAGGVGGCAHPWRGWIVGESERLVGSIVSEDLGLMGAPRIVTDPTRAIDGPGMFPGSRVQPRGDVRVAGKLMHWYFVPPATNRYSSFDDHLVLVWNADGHTYAYGFEVVDGFAIARALDLELARHLGTVGPRRLSRRAPLRRR